MALPAHIPKGTIARPLKVLVPLITTELLAGDSAGLEHYRRAGEMLLEAKDQLAHGSFQRWIGKNFELSYTTAHRYMRLARAAATHDEDGKSTSRGSFEAERPRSLYDAIGERRVQARAAWRDVFKAADHVDVERLKEERQTRDEEVDVRRKMALELINLGYKAMATRLHPDRGGSRDAMARLNQIRDELRDVASTRRFL